MVDDQTLMSSILPSGRASREPTILKRLSLRRASGEKTPIDIDVNTVVAFGPID